MKLIDSYSASNRDDEYYIYLGNAADRAGGQSIRPASACKLAVVRFLLAKQGSITGSIYVKVYNASGTYGANNRPTGSPVGTSVAVDAATLSEDFVWVNFNFSTKVSLGAGSCYVLFLEYNGGDNTNNVLMGIDKSSGAHSGNMVLFDNNLSNTSVVTNGGSTYLCKATHTSSVDDAPGSGVNWTSYWESYSGSGVEWVADQEYSCVLVIFAGESFCFEAYALGGGHNKIAGGGMI
jgi:hypothetical protein